MIERFVRGLARARWFVLLLWLAVSVGSMFVLPSLGKIVQTSGVSFVPADAESAQAKELLDKINPDEKTKSSAVIVLHRDGGLQDGDRQWLEQTVSDMKRDKEKLGIQTVMSAFDSPSLADKFQSKDKTTELVSIGFPLAESRGETKQSITDIRARLTDAPNGASAVLTGNAPIAKDYNETSQNGMKKTEVLTLILVLGILLVVFRSPIAPLVPLLTIALSFLLSRGLIALASKAGMPVSSFTETFLVAVLFGAGTDYCILLIHRFREELGKGLDRVDALVRTMQTVGKTILFAGSTVLIAFFLIGFAKFGLYQSAVGVAIGMAATLIAGLTLTPALMILFGPLLFWPFKIKPGQAHSDSKIWGGMAKLVARRPVVVLLIVVLVLSPLSLFFENKRSFDEIAEVDPNIDSVKGFRTVEKSFSSGEVLPLTLTLTTTDSMRSAEGLAALEKASAALANVDGVAEVRSAARPLGKQIEELTIPNELQTANQALTDIQNGVNKIKDGIGSAADQVKGGVNGADQLQSALTTISGKQREVASGTAKIAQGSAQLADGTSQLAQGTAQVAAGLNNGLQQLQAGAPKIGQLQDGLNQMAQASREAQTQSQTLQDGLAKLQQGMGQIAPAADELQTSMNSMGSDLDALKQSYPTLANDPHFVAVLQKQEGVSKGLTSLVPQLQGINQTLPVMVSGMTQISGGLGTFATKQTEAAKGVGQLNGQIGALQTGLTQSVDALNQMHSGASRATGALNELKTGANKATDGLHQLADGTTLASSKVGDVKSQLSTLSDGLGSGSNALAEVSEGVGKVHDGQQGIADHAHKQLAGWYLPQGQLDKSEDLKKAVDAYVSPDGKLTKIEVILSLNPYSEQAMDRVETLKTTLKLSLNGTVIHNPSVMAAGMTAKDHELNSISKSDFVRTGGLILIGIYLVLALQLRSVLAPLYLLGSLLFSYLVTMGILEFIYVQLLGHNGLSWTVSFFVFLLLVALGVDYSIFLMARFKEEYQPGGVVSAMQKAMASTGGVILSAAVIMSGTFGALIFSGVTALMQIGTAVVIGLLVYSTIVMGLVVPALSMLFGEANWWPFNKTKRSSVISTETSNSN